MIGKVRQYRILKFFFGALLPPKHGGGSSQDVEEKSIYDVLGVSRNATPDEIRKAFRQRAIVFHPDKQMQRNNAFALTDEQTESFQRLKSAYETLMDPTKRKIYDTLGEKAVHYIEQPQAISYQEILANLSHASCWSRTKLNILLLILTGFIIIQPLLICINIDRTATFGNGEHKPYWPWTAVLVPLWCFNIFAFDYFGSLFISLQGSSNNSNNEHYDDDPASSSARNIWIKAVIFSVHGLSQYQSVMFLLLQFILIVVTELLLALKLDGFIVWSYTKILSPLFIQQFFKLLQSIRSIMRVQYDISRMITITQLANKTGKGYTDLTENERRTYNKIYTIVHIPQVAGGATDEEHGNSSSGLGRVDFVQQSNEYLDAKKIKLHAYLEIFSVILHGIFLGLLIYSLESSLSTTTTTSNDGSLTSWWLTFIPIFVLVIGKCVLLCYQAFSSILFPEKIYFPIQQQPNQQQYASSEGFSSNCSARNVYNGVIDPSCESISSESVVSNTRKQKQQQRTSQDDVAAALSDLPDTRTVMTPSSPPTNNNDPTISRYNSISSNLGGSHTNGNAQSGVNGNNTAKEGISDDDDQFFYAARDTNVDLVNYTFRHCFTMIFVLVVLCVFIGKLEGGQYSTIWTMFPLLLLLGIFVFCFCCAVYCVTDIGEETNSTTTTTKYPNNNADSATTTGSTAATISAADPIIVSNQETNNITTPATATTTTANNVPTHSQSSLFEID